MVQPCLLQRLGSDLHHAASSTAAKALGTFPFSFLMGSGAQSLNRLQEGADWGS